MDQIQQLLQQTVANLLNFTDQTIQNQQLDLPVKTDAVQKLTASVKTLLDASVNVTAPPREDAKLMMEQQHYTQDLQLRQQEAELRALHEAAKLQQAQQKKVDN